MRVFVVDDEPKVCQLVKGLVDWEKLKIQHVGEAHNGVEALKGIEQTGANVIITDIQMPGIDGIQLISKLQEKYDDLSFIVISGHSEFSYAQNALRLGVVDYLLKPINKSELEDTLVRIQEERQSNYLDDRFLRLRRNFIQNIIANKSFLNKFTLDEINEEFSYKFENGCFQGFVISLEYHEELDQNVASSLLHQLALILGNTISDYCYDWEVYPSPIYLYGIANFKEDNFGKLQLAYQDFHDEIMRNIKDLNLPVSVTIGIGKKHESIFRLDQSFSSGKNGVEQRILAGSNKVYFGKDKSYTLNSDDMLVTWNRISQQAIDRLDARLALEGVTQLKDETEALSPEGWEFYSIAENASRRFSSLLSGKGLLSDSLDQLEQNFIHRLYSAQNPEQLWKALEDFISTALSELTLDAKTGVSHTIRQAQQYISQNYMHNITLDSVGQEVGLSGAYFSTLFKKELDIGFLDYLTNIRIEEAKHLLATTNKTIVNIASSVGYSDVKHFNRVFRNATVLRPNEYRKIHS